MFFILTVAAAESAIGLAILVLLFRNKNSISVRGNTKAGASLLSDLAGRVPMLATARTRKTTGVADRIKIYLFMLVLLLRVIDRIETFSACFIIRKLISVVKKKSGRHCFRQRPDGTSKDALLQEPRECQKVNFHES